MEKCVSPYRLSLLPKSFNSPRLCLLPLLCCCSYCLWQRVLGKKITETSVNFPPEHSIPPYRHGTHPNVDTHKVDIRVFFSARRLFWFMLYEMTCRSSFKPSLLGSLRSNRGGVKSGLRCGNNAKSLCEKGSSMQR